MNRYLYRTLALAATALAAACTVSNTEPPPLAGPSEMSLSLQISANPDVLSLDGSSQTLVTIDARDHNGQPAANVPLRVEILADGQSIDFGAISARTLVTGSNGRASFTYTAPVLVSGGTIPTVQLLVTPTGTDASAHVRRLIEIRLVPPGTIAGSPVARFTFTPANPAAFSDVRFDGSTSTPGLGATVVNYTWDFGDGTGGSGVAPTHRYSTAGTYIARLTVTDSNGISAQSNGQSVVVTAGAAPVAEWVFSPALPAVGQTIFFNGTGSTAGAGHQIVRYEWNFGTGSTRTGATVSRSFSTPGTYSVALTVTDEVGQTDQEVKAVVVTGASAPSAAFTYSPGNPQAGDTVFFNATSSAASAGATITNYSWNFGDGATASSSSPTASHAFGSVRDFVVTLTVRDSAGRTATTSQTVGVE